MAFTRQCVSMQVSSSYPPPNQCKYATSNIQTYLRTLYMCICGTFILSHVNMLMHARLIHFIPCLMHLSEVGCH